MSLVTVIIPTHNCLPWLPAAIESARDQGSMVAEILVVDDASTDDTAVWLYAQRAREPRLRVIAAAGIGPARARNLAISQARTPFVAFLDADDVWRPGMIDRALLAVAMEPRLSFCFADYRHVSIDGTDLGGCFDFWPRFRAIVAGRPQAFLVPDALATLLAENVVGTSTVVASRVALQNANGFAVDLPSSEDWDLWLRLAAAGPVAAIPALGADYLVRPNSVSRRADDRIRAMEMILARAEALMQPADRWATRFVESRLSVARAEAASALGRKAAAARHALRGAWLAPSWRTARAAASALAGRSIG